MRENAPTNSTLEPDVQDTTVEGAREFNRQHAPIDHISHFAGLAVAQFYMVAAAVTVYEVTMRYLFNAPTQWAFEIVMVLCASSWMVSAGYVTLKRRHIGITVFYLMADWRWRWRLDLLAFVIGIIALFLLLTETTEHALKAIDIVERTGSGFNSPMPTVLKTLQAVGATLYLAQLFRNLHSHFTHRWARRLVSLGAALIAVRILTQVSTHYFDVSMFATLEGGFATLGDALNPRQIIDASNYSVGSVSVAIVASLFLLMMTGIPLGIVTLFVSILCALLYFGPNGMYLVSSNAFGLLEKYPLVAVPLFVLMASILERAGLAQDLFDAMSIFAGNLRGGVAVQTIAVAVVLAAMSGVMGGEIVMLGLVALPQMLRLGYDRRITIGVICASGALATLIPPSIVMIIYGLSANVSIGNLFLAGAVPGLMLASFYTIYVLVLCRINPRLAPTASEVAELTGGSTRLGLHRQLSVALCMLLIACVLGSIYAGIASVTEAAGVGVFGAIIVAVVRNRFNWSLLQTALAGTMSTVGTIIWLILGAVAFVGIYNLIGGGDFMRSLFSNLGFSAIGIILVMMGILIVLGTFMEWIAIVLITVPVFAPVVVDKATELGLDPSWAAVWFGVLFVMNIQIYFLSPPFGPACFWLKSVAPPDISLHEIFIAVLPFIALQIVGVALVIIFPEIALFLPKLLSG